MVMTTIEIALLSMEVVVDQELRESSPGPASPSQERLLISVSLSDRQQSGPLFFRWFSTAAAED